MATVLIHPDIPESRPARPLTIHVIADKFRDIVTISDPNQRFYKPIFTIIISIINILLLIVAFIYNGGINLTTLTLIRMGGQFVPCMKPAATKIRLMDVVCTRGEGKEWPLYDKCTYDQFLKYRCYSFLYPYQLYRFLTAMFLHANMLHLILNVLNIMIVGFSLETKYGTVKISLVYILSGLTGGLLSAVFQRQSISVGASGACYGLVFFYLMDRLQALYTLDRRQILIQIASLVVPYIIISIFVDIDHFGHIGGALTGFLIGLMICGCPIPAVQARIDELRLKQLALLLLIIINLLFILIFFFTKAPRLSSVNEFQNVQSSIDNILNSYPIKPVRIEVNGTRQD